MGYGAGVYDVNVGPFLFGNDFVSRLGKPFLYHFRFILIYLAPKGFNCCFHATLFLYSNFFRFLIKGKGCSDEDISEPPVLDEAKLSLEIKKVLLEGLQAIL